MSSAQIFFGISLVFCEGMLAQPSESVPVLTVCEALNGLEKYNGSIVIVVGREGYTDEGSWLGQECGGVVVTKGFKWSDTVWTSRQVEAAPTMPTTFRWNDNAVKEKLMVVQRTTTLRRYRGKLSAYNDRWMAIFGRLETRLPLPVLTYATGERRGIGFGHLGAAPAQLIFCIACIRELKPN